MDVRADATVTDYRIPFRAISNDLQNNSFDEGNRSNQAEDDLPKIAMNFTLADGKR